jgi:hypothetical protein
MRGRRGRLLGIYLGIARGVVGLRLGVHRWQVALFVLPFTALVVAIVADATSDNVQYRARVDAGGLPGPLFSLRTRLACVVPVAGPYPYLGQPVERTAGPVVHFGRAGGRTTVRAAGKHVQLTVVPA